MVIIGKEIEKRVKELQIGIPHFASSINRSRPVIYNIFRRSSIDTDLLQKISEVLHYNFFMLYKHDYSNSLHEPKEKYPAIDSNEELIQKELKATKDELTQLKKEIAELKEKYSIMLRLNTLLEEKLPPKPAKSK